MAFQKFARMDQSMFARLVRLGVKYTQLNFQVCEASLCSPFGVRLGPCSMHVGLRFVGSHVWVAGAYEAKHC